MGAPTGSGGMVESAAVPHILACSVVRSLLHMPVIPLVDPTV